MFVALLLIPVLCIIAGYGVFQLAGSRPLRIDSAPGLFVLGLCGSLTLGWAALVAAELGVFSGSLVAAGGVLLGIAGLAAARRRGSRIRLTRGALSSSLYPLGLIVAMAFLYLRPHEFIFGGADAGVYVNLGASISHSGGWIVSNPDMSALPQGDYPMLFRAQPPNLLPRFYHLPGFYITDDDAGVITPQFYPLHPAWLAIAHGLGGLPANLALTPVWGLLGVVAFYFAMRESFDGRLAAIAAAVLALTPTQIWFARYPTAEVLTQYLFFGGLYAFARYVRTSETWAAIVAGLALGQVMLVRIDTYFLLAAPIVYGVYLRLKRILDRRFWAFALPLFAMSAHSLIHAVWQGWPYLNNSLLAGNALPIPPRLILALGAAGVVAFAIVDRLVARRPESLARLKRWPRPASTAAAIGLILLALYAYFLRPSQADPSAETPYWYSSSTIPDVEPYNLVRLGWYVSPLGIALGALGVALMVRNEVSRRTWLLIGSGVFFALLYVYRTYNNPHHVYVMRRYVPAVIPLFAAGSAYVLNKLASQTWRARALAVTLGLAQVGWMVYTGRVMIRQIDYQGGVDQYRAFAQALPSEAIVLFNDDQPVGAAGLVGTPLAYLSGYTVLDLQEDQIEPARLDALVDGWLAAARPVVVVNGPSHVRGLCDRWRCRPIAESRFDLPLLEASYEHFPTAITPLQFTLDVYQVESTQPASGGS